jgi:hypothetical protein
MARSLNAQTESQQIKQATKEHKRTETISSFRYIRRKSITELERMRPMTGMRASKHQHYAHNSVMSHCNLLTRINKKFIY